MSGDRAERRTRQEAGCCSTQAAILDLKMLNDFFTNWQSAMVLSPLSFPQPCHLIFAPGQPYDPEPKGLRCGPSGAFQDSAPGQDRVCPNWYAHVTRVTGYFEHHSRRKVHYQAETAPRVECDRQRTARCLLRLKWEAGHSKRRGRRVRKTLCVWTSSYKRWRLPEKV